MDDIDELKAEVKDLKDQVQTLREERDEALDLVTDMREQIEDSRGLLDRWIEVFRLVQDENGVWQWDAEESSIWRRYADLLDEHNKLVREWNKFVGEYNATVAPRGVGRPLQASDAQVKTVQRLRRRGAPLRAIVAKTGRTVRTIVERESGTGRIGKKANELRKKELNRLRAAEYRAS